MILTVPWFVDGVNVIAWWWMWSLFCRLGSADARLDLNAQHFIF